eukprot:SAG11_NODE_25586_length_356_cov_4.863813_1_plen_72_part_10
MVALVRCLVRDPDPALKPAGLYPVKMGSVCPNGPDPKMSKWTCPDMDLQTKKSGSCRETTGGSVGNMVSKRC